MDVSIINQQMTTNHRVVRERINTQNEREKNAKARYKYGNTSKQSK